MDDETRRHFLKTAGAAAFTLGAVGGCGVQPPGPGPDPDPDPDPGDGGFEPPLNVKLAYDDMIYNACGICMIRCGMQVYVKDGEAVYVEGNPADPFNNGHLCPKGKAALGFLYNPDRLMVPLRRTNSEKGIGIDPQWEEITWDEAYDAMVEQITRATESAPGAADFANGEAFALITHGAYDWGARLLTAIGSPNLVTHYDACFTTSFVARKALTGSLPWTNLAGAKYILSFGWDQPERSKNQPTGQFSNACMNGARVVCLNPWQGVVGAKADEWIAIMPGTDLAVMLGMICHILANDLYDATAVARTNFADHEADIRAAFAEYTPEWAEAQCGVPAATIARLAEEFTDPANQPAIIPIHKRDGAGGPNYANSFQTAHASLILNAFVGAIDRDGGDACLAFGWKPKAHLTFEEDPPKNLKTLIDEKGAIDGKHNFPLVRDLTTDRGIFANLAQRILDQDPYQLKMAIFYRYGLLSFPNPAKIAEALSTLDYVVFADTMPKEVMWFADLVLPQPMFLENNYISYRKFCTPGQKLVMAGNRAVQPVGNFKSWTSIAMTLGKKLDELRGTNYFKLAGGDWVTPTDEKNSMASDIVEGWTLDDVLAVENGVWAEDAPYTAKSEYSTPSGKIEIYSEKMEAAGYEPLPSWLPRATASDAEYPLYLLLMRWAGLKHSAPLTSDNRFSLDAFPGPVAKIHPETATDLGIADGDTVWIESTNGRMKVQAVLTERIRPDCVLTNHNYGHTMSGLTYPQSDQGDGVLIVDRPEQSCIDNGDWSAGAWMSDVCVKVYKA
ncbi:MAG: molybdopterin-dependent oxidoreductase [Phycisphaerales bacterium]|nr:MAG: molybdopterin-dependent oxidoreductase [Phycisphaerales bacterium]